jgi:hypothetical protein
MEFFLSSPKVSKFKSFFPFNTCLNKNNSKLKKHLKYVPKLITTCLTPPHFTPSHLLFKKPMCT